jgi:hypothetical protein
MAFTVSNKRTIALRAASALIGLAMIAWGFAVQGGGDSLAFRLALFLPLSLFAILPTLCFPAGIRVQRWVTIVCGLVLLFVGLFVLLLYWMYAVAGACLLYSLRRTKASQKPTRMY